MSDTVENKHRNQLNSSRELLYSDFTGTTVVEHVISCLEKPKDLSESKFKRKREVSGALERAKRLLLDINETEKGDNKKHKSLEAPIEDEEAIDVHVIIGEENFDTKTENFKADFFLPQSEVQESEEQLQNFLECEDLSSDFDYDLTDNESLSNFSVLREKKNLLIEEVSSNLDDECEV